MIHGKDLILTIDSVWGLNTALAGSKTCDVDVETDFIEVASPTEGGWKNYIPTINSWGLSAGLLLAKPETYNMLFGYQTNHTMLTVRFYDPEMGMYYKGNTYIKGLKMTGNVGSLVSISLSFQPTGPLTPATVTDFTCGGEGKTINDFKIDWEGTTPEIVDEDRVPTDSIDWYEIDVTGKAKTRISVDRYIIVIKDTAENVTTLIETKDNTTLLSKAVLITKNETGHVVVGPGTYTVITNTIRLIGTDGSYVSTF